MNDRRGFTIIELLLAVMLLGVLVVVVYSTFIESVNAGKRAVDVSLRYARALRVLEEMGRELESAFLQKSYRGEEATKPLTIFKGEDDTIFTEDADRITFWTLSSNYVLSGKGDTNISEIAEISYFWEADYEKEELSLWKRLDQTPDYDHSKGGYKVRIIPDIKSVNFRYFDGSEWKDEWDADKLPYAVEIVLSVFSEEKEKNKEERGFFTLKKVVILRLAEKENAKNETISQ